VSTATRAGAPVLGAIDEAIGHTPLVRLRLPGVPPGVELWGKCEWFNPGGSVKDRTALSIIREGERTGALRGGRTIIDSSSGNTAVGLALVGRARGYAVELFMPASVAMERRRICEAYGAAITLTDAFSGSDGAILAVRERVNRVFARETKQSYEKIVADTQRNFWMNATQAQEYGLIARIVQRHTEV